MNIYKLLSPDLTIDSVLQLDLGFLKDKGVRGLLLDLDNTIIPWNQENVSDAISSWLMSLTEAGFILGIVSNNRTKRVRDIAEHFRIPFVARAYKPAKSGFRQVAAVMGLETSQLAVIGDQLYTDILGGNRLGYFTIWVKPISTVEFAGTKITRQIEKLTVKILRAKGFLA